MNQNKSQLQTELKEAQDKIDKLKATIDKMDSEPTLKKGDLIEVWDSDIKPSHLNIREFDSFGITGLVRAVTFYGETRIYTHYQPYTPPVKWIEHTGNECPVDDDIMIAGKKRSGIAECKKAYCYDWSNDGSGINVIEYIVIED